MFSKGTNSIMINKTKILFFTILISINFQMCAQQSSKITPEIGPQNGTLFIVGGGRLSDDIILAFIEVAGGLDAPIVVIPTASGGDSFTDNVSHLFTSRGATNVSILHTKDRNEADSDEFVAPIKKAKAVWFTGGRQWRLVDSYKDTKTEEELWKLLNRNGLIGGSSAGATIQGSYLARGDTKHNQIMMGDHEEGFGFLKNVAIDQHVLARNRQFDLFEILKKRPELLGIGIDENTAIVVQGDVFEVLGSSYVLMYDGSFWSNEGFGSKTLPPPEAQFYFLKEGDRYNLKSREVIK